MNTGRRLVEHYESCFSKFGDSAKGFDWPTEDDSDLRHRVMWDILPANSEKLTVLDFGCGSLRSVDYLKAQGRFDPNRISITGIDLSEKFVELSRNKHPDVKVECLDIHNPDHYALLGEFDYVICNGVFTLRQGISEQEMNSFFASTVRALFARTRVGMAFNVMSRDIVDWERDDLYFRSFNDNAQFFKKELGTRDFIFRQDYGLYEFTSYVFRSQI